MRSVRGVRAHGFGFEAAGLGDDGSEDDPDGSFVEIARRDRNEPLKEGLFSSGIEDREAFLQLFLTYLVNDFESFAKQLEQLLIDGIDLGAQRADIRVVDHGGMLPEVRMLFTTQRVQRTTVLQPEIN